MKAEQMGDIEAAKEIYPLIEKDRQAIGTLTELIKNGREIARTQEPDTIGNNLNIGIYEALGNMMQAGKGFNEALLTPVLEYGMGLDATQRKLLFKTVKYINPSSNALETLGETGREIVKIADERAETARVNRDYNGSAWAALKKGEVGKAANYGFKDFAMSFPSSAAYMTGWGAALMSGGIVTGKQIGRAHV